MHYSVSFGDDDELGLQVAPRGRDRHGHCRGLLVAGLSRWPVEGVTVGDEIAFVNDIPLDGFGSEAALSILSLARHRRLTFRCRGKSGEAGREAGASDGDSLHGEAKSDSGGDKGAPATMEAVFDSEAAASRAASRDTYLVRFAEGKVGLLLLPVDDGPACGGLVVDSVFNRRPLMS